MRPAGVLSPLETCARAGYEACIAMEASLQPHGSAPRWVELSEEQRQVFLEHAQASLTVGWSVLANPNANLFVAVVRATANALASRETAESA